MIFVCSVIILIQILILSPAMHCLGFTWTERKYVFKSDTDGYWTSQSWCESTGGHMFDLRGHYAKSALNLLLPYYETPSIFSLIRKRFFLGMHRPSTMTGYPPGTTNFSWYDGQRENGTSFSDYYLETSNGDSLQACITLYHTAEIWYLTIVDCLRPKAFVCERETAVLCPYEVYKGRTLQTDSSNITAFQNIPSTETCHTLCEDFTLDTCWAYAYSEVSRMCHILSRDTMYHNLEFCDWLEPVPEWTTYRRMCLDIVVYALDETEISLRNCMYDEIMPGNIAENLNTSSTNTYPTFAATELSTSTIKGTPQNSDTFSTHASDTFSTRASDTSSAHASDTLSTQRFSTAIVNPETTTTQDDGMTESISSRDITLVTNTDLNVSKQNQTTLKPVDPDNTHTGLYSHGDVQTSSVGIRPSPDSNNSTIIRGPTSEGWISEMKDNVTEKRAQTKTYSTTRNQESTIAVSATKKSCKRVIIEYKDNFMVEHLLRDLQLDKRNTSLFKRRFYSSSDDRLSSRCLGLMGVTVIVCAALWIIFLDTLSLVLK